ncbi:FKBP-type peptidyl-prolyl cis-trans isomerase [Roseivirga echinicomitans]
MKPIRTFLILAFVALAFSACKEDVIFDADEQFVREGILIDQYLAEKNLVAQTDESGIRYTITEQGTGENAKFGSTVVVKYTGYLLDGSTFDTNVGSGNGYDFVIGQDAVIQGWNIAFKLFNKGTEATIYIPSKYGYGNNGNPIIPANSVLIFDVRVVDILGN